MIKKIILLNNSAVFDDRSEFIISDNEELELELINKYKNSKAYLISDDFCYFMEGNKIKLKNLKSGLLKCVIEIRDCDVVINRYSLEPLKIKRLDTKYEIIPEIEDLKNQIKRIEPVIEEIKVLHNSIKTLAKAILKVVKIGGDK